MKTEMHFINTLNGDEGRILIDIKSGHIFKENYTPELNSCKGLLSEDFLRGGELNTNIKEYMGSMGYELISRHNHDNEYELKINHYFDEADEFLIFERTNLSIAIDITEQLHHQSILAKGSDFSLIGTDEAIILDGDLSEFLESSDAAITKISYNKKLEYDDTYGIINCVEKEIIGYVEVTQRDNKRYYKMFCGNTNSSDMTEFIDFEKAFLNEKEIEK